jgi:hypothetical protein
VVQRWIFLVPLSKSTDKLALFLRLDCTFFPAMTLPFPLLPTTQDYTVTVQTTSLLGNMLYENTRHTIFRKQPLQKTPQGWLYAVSVLSFKQTENNGVAQLDADTAQLRSKLLIETDASGGMLRVCNKEELRDKWKEIPPFRPHNARYGGRNWSSAARRRLLGRCIGPRV